MFSMKSKSSIFILFFFIVLFGELCLNHSDYIVEDSEVVCELGRIESFTSPRSSSTLFYAMESGVRFYAESFNRNEGAPYTSVVDGQYSFNREVKDLCYFKTTRFFYFDVYYVVYFGDYSIFLKNYDGVMHAVSAINVRSFIYFLYLFLCFLGFVALVKKIGSFYG
ncbi:hypothetical protein ORJ04_09995 [Rheinheimera baltica]|uniref:GOLD domain-containing protein n=1 Tax=Rheinheimera baltica TaxID=67576 RepID=A0ABT9HYR7_9GAMM|nr:hypothetical protein [Rheinheimera baltica]MDP5136282.1 hypothetical protein [Rheinheimera baltica]